MRRSKQASLGRQSANLRFRLKDCDVTWLYGPLQTGHFHLGPDEKGPTNSTLAHASSFIDKKPILKKRSMSEIMLQRSLSSSSLLKQATAVVQAQVKEGRILPRPSLQRSNTDIPFSIPSRHISRESASLATSTTASSTSGAMSPNSERKRIHFNEQVEQCIVVDVKGDDYEVDSDPYGLNEGSDSSEGGVMMKRSTRSKARAPPQQEKGKIEQERIHGKQDDCEAPVHDAQVPRRRSRARRDGHEAQHRVFYEPHNLFVVVTGDAASDQEVEQVSAGRRRRRCR